MDGMRASGDEYYEKQNLQDLWLTSENFSNEKISQIIYSIPQKKKEKIFLNLQVEQWKGIILWEIWKFQKNWEEWITAPVSQDIFVINVTGDTWTKSGD